MDILKPKAVIDTNAWGRSAYEKLIGGFSVGKVPSAVIAL